MQEISGLISVLGRSSGGGNGNPLQYSCFRNPMDRGDWWAVSSTWGRKSWIWLSDWTHTQIVYFSNLIDDKCLSSILISIHLNLRIHFFFFFCHLCFFCVWLVCSCPLFICLKTFLTDFWVLYVLKMSNLLCLICSSNATLLVIQFAIFSFTFMLRK